jgi:predicted glycosyltransferase
VGGALAEAAVRARPLSRRAGDAPWRVLLGGNLAQDRFDAIRAAADAGTVVERNRPDFTRLLAACRLSVSQAGYNTVTELLAAGVPGVVVPFEGDGGEREQALRAERLAAAGRLTRLREAELTPARLAAAVDRTLAPDPAAGAAQAGSSKPDLAGVATSARLLAGLALGAHPTRADPRAG